MLLPVEIGDFTDFYASVYHATNVGRHVPAGKPAASKLQVRSGWLPWPRVFGGRQRHADTPSQRADPGFNQVRNRIPSQRSSGLRGGGGVLGGPRK